MVATDWLAAGLVGLVALAAVRVTWVRRTLRSAARDCEEAWGNLDALLDRYVDEVETVIEVTGGAAGYHTDPVPELSDARRQAVQSGTPGERATAYARMQAALPEVRALAAEYEALTDHEGLQSALETVDRLEERLENRRANYNRAVAAYNRVLERPSGLILRLLGDATTREPFEPE